MLAGRRLPGESARPVKTQQSVFRSQPEIAVRRLSNLTDCAFGETLADPPRRVRVLADVERRIERHNGGRPEQEAECAHNEGRKGLHLRPRCLSQVVLPANVRANKAPLRSIV